MASAAVDVGYLAAAYSVPDTDLHSLLSDPTTELVQSLLVQIQAKAREFDDLQTEKLKADIELDNTIRRDEQHARVLKAAADKAQKDADEQRQKLAEEETARKQLESQLQTLKASTSDSATQIQTLESRIQNLESQKRDALATYNTKATAYDQLAQELADQHQKFVDLRKQVSEFENKNQSLESAASGAKFRESNLQQEIEVLRKNNEWYETEMKTRANDNSKFRKEKNAQVAELQRTNADATDTIESLRRSETSLRKHVNDLKQKAEEDQARIQQLEVETTTQESNFRSELENSKRLIVLHQKTSETAKARQAELKAEVNSLQDAAAMEIGQLQAEVESEHQAAIDAEAKVANLESIIQDMESQATQFKNSAAIPATPRRTINGAFGTPGRAGSPASFSPGGSTMRGTASNGMLITENEKFKKDLRKLREEDEKKTTLIAEMLEELQRLQPIVNEHGHTTELLSTQISDMTTEVEKAIAEKDAARKDQRKARGELEVMQRECGHLRQQAEDLSVQLRSLIWRRQAQEQGLGVLTAEQQQFIANSENNQMPADQSYGDTATDVLISQHLVLYKNITDLQTQNASLLRTIREVAHEYEGDEARSKKDQLDKDQAELSKLRSQVAEYEEDVKSLTTRANCYKKERDVYREVATSRGIALPDVDSAPNFGQSFNSQIAMTPLRGGNNSQIVPMTPQVEQVAGMDTLVKTMQNQMDTMREESAADRTALKLQVDTLTKDHQQLQGEKLRLDNQLRREQDRCTRLESYATLHDSEKDILQERLHNVQAALAEQDKKIVKAEQDAVEAVSHAQDLERELANLKAVQSMWQSIEARLTERNQELVDERDRLNRVVSHVQKVQNEQELANTEKRRELQEKLGPLESELQAVRQKLEDEIAGSRKASLQREWERSEAQKRIDDLIKAKNEADVRAASADAARQQLEQRLGDLQAQLHATEKQMSTLRPRRATDGETEEDVEQADREEELAEQVLDLQRKLRSSEGQLEDAEEYKERFKKVALEAEEALNESVEAYNLYQEEMTRVSEEKDATITDLQQRWEEISSQLVSTSSELADLRSQHEQETSRLQQENGTLDAEISRLKEDVADYKAEVDRQIEYVKTQAEIATRARQDYEEELDKHGETMKSLRTLREEHTGIQTELAKSKVEAQAARTALDLNEDHWKSLQEKYESQIIEAKRIQEDLKSTNKVLLKQFDEYKSQIDNLRAITSGDAPPSAASREPGSTSSLEALVVYLRREKEMKEIEFNIKDQEARRLESQLEYAQTKLDQMREKLLAAQAETHSLPSHPTITKLENQLEQLKVFRESNVLLRNDLARLETKLKEKTQEAETLQTELEPLRWKVIELESEVELAQGFHKQADEAREFWQNRYNKWFSSKDRVAPEEFEKLKKESEELQQERDQVIERTAALEENIKTLETGQAAAIEAAKEAQKEEFKSKFNKRHKEILEKAMNGKQTEIDALKTERDELQANLASLQQELDTARQQLQEAQTSSDQSQQQVESLKQELTDLRSQLEAAQQEVESAKTAANETADVNMGEEGQINETDSHGSNEQVAGLQKALDDTKKQLAEAQNRAYKAENDYSALQVKESLLKDKVAKLEQDHAEQSNRIVELQGQLSTSESGAAQSSTTTADQGAFTELEKVKQELNDVQKALDLAKSQAATTSSTIQAVNEPNPGSAATEEQTATTTAALEARETKLKELEANLEQREVKVTRREGQAAGIRDQANNKIKEIRQTCAAEVANLQAEIASLKQEKQAVGTETTSNDNAASAPVPPAAPTIDAEDKEVRDFFAQNKTAQAILRSNVNNRTNILTDQIKALKAENESLKAEKSTDTPVKEEIQDQPNQQDVETALSKAKAEHELSLKKSLEKAEQMHAMKAKMKEEQVGKIWPGAIEAGNKAKEQYTAQEKQKAAEAQAASKQNQLQPGAAPPNGAKPATSQQQNAVLPAGLMSQVAAPHMQMGRGSGITPPGSMSQPQPSFPAQQQQQGGRGRGDGVGTGPGALRGLVGNQSNIPRGGGSGIPQPGGRGRGQQQPSNIVIPNAQNLGQSQIGRGGARGGRGGGRGGPGNPASPRANLNPGAQQFTPGGGRGQGQKRGPEDDGEGASRGGKRPRGRGGGSGPQGGAPAAE